MRKIMHKALLTLSLPIPLIARIQTFADVRGTGISQTVVHLIECGFSNIAEAEGGRLKPDEREKTETKSDGGEW